MCSVCVCVCVCICLCGVFVDVEYVASGRHAERELGGVRKI